MNISPALKTQFAEYEYRQELHDRLFHKDIYNLSKVDRLTHLVLHQVKYVSRIFDYQSSKWHSVFTERSEVNGTDYRKSLIDGIIVGFSILNTLNEQFLSGPGNHYITALVNKPELITTLLIKTTGCMAKAIEDIDHMAHVDVSGILTKATIDLITGYVALLTIPIDLPFNNWEGIFSQCVTRLVEVEQKNCFCEKLTNEMDGLLSLRKNK